MADRTVLVSGGAGGLGGAVTAAFVASGWRVVVPVRPDGGAAPAGVPGEPGGEVLRVAADLTDPEQVARAVEVAGGDAGAPLRAVVNLAGGYAAGGLVHETPVADFEEMIARNLRPTYLVTRSALPYLLEAGGGSLEAGGGSVVCVSSRAALAPSPVPPATSPGRRRYSPSPRRSPSNTGRRGCAATRWCRASSTRRPTGRRSPARTTPAGWPRRRSPG
ncbi:hypothetical protein GCM10027615_00210 [Plantactinospora veratri]